MTDEGRQPKSRIWGKWFEIVLGVIITVVVGFVTWMGSQMYALNREVGELRQRIDAAAESSRESAAAQRETQERLQRQIDRLQDRLDAGTTSPQLGNRKP